MIVSIMGIWGMYVKNSIGNDNAYWATPKAMTTTSPMPITGQKQDSYWHTLKQFWHLLRRYEKTILWVYLSSFVLTLFLLEAFERQLIVHFPLSFAIGLLGGVGVAILKNQLDDTIKSQQDLCRTLPLPLLGLAPANTPVSTQAYALQTALADTSEVADAFRLLRNNLLLLTQHNTPKILNITSTDASEGKSSTIINLATAFAQSGKRVLLIDADLRRPTLHKHFNTNNIKGLGNYLAGLNRIESLIQPTFIANISLLPAGPVTPHQVELLASDQFKALIAQLESPEAPFELVMVDSPPVMGMADALLLSNRAHATLLVAACYQTRKRALVSSFQKLQQARGNLLGMVMTKAPV